MKIQFKLIVFASFCIIGLSVLSCKNQKATEAKNTTEAIIDSVFNANTANTKKFILVRHAEKLKGTNPDLTAEGVLRAENLAVILSKIELDRIYSTNTNRTLQTAKPTANDKGLTIKNYGAFNHNPVINAVLNTTNESKVLIVGHSNTLHNFLNALTGTTDYTDIPENEFNNLYVVSSRAIGDSDVVRLNY